MRRDFDPPTKCCATCRGTSQGYGCPCWKCDGRGWKYKNKVNEAWYQNQLRWGRKVDNYLEIEIGDAHQKVIKIAEQPIVSWLKLNDAIDKLRSLVECRGQYVATRRAIDLVCEKCKCGDEPNEDGHAVYGELELQPDPDTKIGYAKCHASALWDELKEIEKGERADVD